MDLVLSLVVLAAIALLAGAYWLRKRGGTTKQISLMLLLAFIMIANVLIWTIPDSAGTAPIQRTAQGAG
jgi:hypothetical protein